jgi:hypothetical protein
MSLMMVEGPTLKDKLSPSWNNTSMDIDAAAAAARRSSDAPCITVRPGLSVAGGGRAQVDALCAWQASTLPARRLGCQLSSDLL